MQATTDNYYAVAVKDDTEVEKPRTAAPVGDKAARSLIRQERMQAAVERSRSEYRAEHAYTEHMVCRGSTECRATADDGSGTPSSVTP